MKYIFTFLTVLYLFSSAKAAGPSRGQIKSLFNRLKKLEYSQDHKLIFNYTTGLYESEIKLNIVTNETLWEIYNEKAQVPDNNMFVTNFVVSNLILCKDEFDTIDFQESFLYDSIEALLEFQNKNWDDDKKKIPIYNFWQQVLEGDTWVCQPDNMLNIADYLESLPKYIQKLLKKYFFISADLINGFASSFRIPPDNDDSGINIALGALLKKYSESYKTLNFRWQHQNSNFQHFYYVAIKDYSYRPFSDNKNYNTIDPRSYYYLQGYFNKTLEKFEALGKEPTRILFNTWLTNQRDEDDLVKMPFRVNNVDVTVNANSLFGLSTLLLGYENDEEKKELQELYKEEEFQQIIEDVTDLLTWALESEIALERPDLALTYYPSAYNFYYFVARISNFLNNQDKEIEFEKLVYCQQQLDEYLLKYGSKSLLDLQIEDPETGLVYWESFLGNYYEPKQHLDRAFSTAMVLNALIDIHTEKKGGKIQYRENTAQEVIDAIDKGSEFLSLALDDETTSLMNTFFSGSVKTNADLPYIYPANKVYYQDGEVVDPTKFPPFNGEYNNFEEQEQKWKNDDKHGDLIDSFEGFVSPSEYQYMLNNQTWFGFQTPQTFDGFNEIGSPFPYWTSDAITLSFSMLAFSKYIQINE